MDEYCDIDGYWQDFLNMFGFGFEEINYDENVEFNIKIKNLKTKFYLMLFNKSGFCL